MKKRVKKFFTMVLAITVLFVTLSNEMMFTSASSDIDDSGGIMVINEFVDDNGFDWTKDDMTEDDDDLDFTDDYLEDDDDNDLALNGDELTEEAEDDVDALGVAMAMVESFSFAAQSIALPTGPFNINDIEVIHAMIDNNDLVLPKAAPADGSMIPYEWNEIIVVSEWAEWPLIEWKDVDGTYRIKSLTLPNQGLTDTLDVSGLKYLEFLYCVDNQLTGLILGNLEHFVDLTCNRNQLTELDVSGVPNIRSLFCGENKIESLDLSGLSKLEQLFCHQNQLTELDVENLTTLRGLGVSENKISTLKVSNLVELEFLYCSNNLLTELDTGELAKLRYFSSNGNPLETLDLSKAEILEYVRCENSQLTSLHLNVNAPYELIDARYNFLTKDAVTGKADTWDWDGVNFLFSPQKGENGTISGPFHLGDIAVINAIIEKNGLNWTPADPTDDSKVPYDWDGIEWDDSSPKRIRGLGLSEQNLSGTLDVSGLANLEWLSCWDNNLTELDVSKLVNLEYLHCARNNLDVLDVSGLINLKILYCWDNNLTSLDAKNLTSLVQIFCDNNKLASLNVSGLVNLIELGCGGNNLTSLDVSGLTNLKWVYCNDNQLTSLILDPIAPYEVINASNNPELTFENITGRSLLWNSDFTFPRTNQNNNDSGSSTVEPTPTPSPSPEPTPTPPPVNFGDTQEAAPVWTELTNTISTAINNVLNDTLVNNPANSLGANTVTNAAGDGFDLVVVTGTEIVVPAQIFETLQGTAGTVMMNTGAGVTFSISGGNIPVDFDVESINLTLRDDGLNAPPNKIAEVKAGTITSIEIPMESRESFGMVIGQHFNVGAENAGNFANLYRFNETTGEFEYLGSFEINERGQAMFGIAGGADYVLTVTAQRPTLPIVATVDVSTYIVRPGDNLSRIARAHGMSLPQIIALNPQIQSPGQIRVGDRIRVR
jgi:hypothetical protein